MAQQQTYANHVRYHAPFHYCLSPLMLLLLVWSVAQVVRHPGWETAMGLVLTLVLVVTVFLTRVYAMKVQDRVIRLEEHLRFARLLPAEVARQATEKIPLRFIIALRFASDEELPGLVGKVLDGSFAQPAEVKKAIQTWRGDYWRV